MPKGKKKEKEVVERVERVRKAAEPQLSRQQKIEALTADINKQYKGSAVIREGRHINNAFLLRRPTGVITLDIALGGGFPAGGLSQIIGKDSSGKSYLVNRTIAKCQEIYGADAAISNCMTEMRWDKRFAKWHCGVRVALDDQEIRDLERSNATHGLPPYTEEQKAWLRDQVGIVQETTAENAEQLLEVACQHIESNLYQIVMIDSFGALLTKAEAEHEEGLEGKHRGGAAMVITQFMHRLHAALNMNDAYGRPNTTTVLGINQYRDNVGAGLYGNPLKIAGGYALRHGKLVDLHLEQGKRHQVKMGDEYKIVGKEINWELIKGKAGCHDGPKGSYNFYFGQYGYGFGIDTMTDLLVAGLEVGVVEQKGAWYTCEGDNIGQGAVQAAVFLAGNLAMQEKIRLAALSKAGISYITKEE